MMYRKYGPADFEKLIKQMKEWDKEPKMTSEEFEQKYPRKRTPYEIQRMEKTETNGPLLHIPGMSDTDGKRTEPEVS